MLRKVELRIMEPTTDRHQFSHDLEVFELRAKEAAFSLHTLCHLSFAPKESFPYTFLAEQLFALSALIPALRRLLVPLFSRRDAPVSEERKIGMLATGIGKCGVVVEGIERAVKEVHTGKWLGAESEEEKEKGKQEFAPYMGDEKEAQETLHTCIRHILVALTAGRAVQAEYTPQGDLLASDRPLEVLRLTNALKHPFYTALPELITPSPIATMPTHQKAVPLPPSSSGDSTRDVLELQQPRGFRGRYGHPDLPLCEGEKSEGMQLSLDVVDASFEEAESVPSRLSSEGTYPDVGAFEATIGSPVLTPESTRDNTPAVESGREMGAAVAERKDDKGKESPGRDQVEDATAKLAAVSVAEKEDKTTQALILPNAIQNSLNPPPNPPTHLEAYVLLPYTGALSTAPEWTYKTSPLPLDEVTLQAHIHDSGTTHSIVDDLCVLHPEQLRLINLCAKQRQGTLVSVQLGKAIHLPVGAWMCAVKPAVFVVRTSRPEEEKYNLNSDEIAPPPPLPFHNSATKTSAFGGFGSSSAPAIGFGASGTKPAPSSGFGAFGTAPAPPTTGIFARNPSPPPKPPFNAEKVKQYREQVGKNGEVCTYAEASPSLYDPLQHFQTVIPLLSKELSFEELRLVEMRVGFHPGDRAEQGAVPGLFGQTASTGERGLFGSSSTTAGTASGGLFGSAAQSSSSSGTEGLVGSSSQPATVPGTTGLFGTAQPASTSSGGLSGASGASNENRGIGGLFGHPPPATSASSGGGLFGNAANQTTQQTTSSLFGGRNNNPPTVGLSGHAQPSPSTSSADGLFGTPAAQNKTQSTSSVLGKPQSATTVPQTQPAGSSNLFGKAPSTTAAPSPASSLFGNRQPTPPAAPSGGLFGSHAAQNKNAQPTSATSSSQPTQPSGSGLFGAAPAPSTSLVSTTQPTATTGRFGNAPSAGLFATAQPASSTPSQGLFGNAQSGRPQRCVADTAPDSASISFPKGGSLFPAPSQKNNASSSSTSGVFSIGDKPKPSLFADSKKPPSTSPSDGLFGSAPADKPKNTTTSGSPFSTTPTTTTAAKPAASPANPSFNGGCLTPRSTTVPPPLSPNPPKEAGAASSEKLKAADSAPANTISPTCCKICKANLFAHLDSEKGPWYCDPCAKSIIASIMERVGRRVEDGEATTGNTGTAHAGSGIAAAASMKEGDGEKAAEKGKGNGGALELGKPAGS